MPIEMRKRGEANVTSIEALAAFRAELIVFAGDAKQALDETAAGVARMRDWLLRDRRREMERDVRRKELDLDRCRQELLGARLSPFRSADAQQAALRKAQRSLEASRDKLEAIKRWGRQFEHAVGPMLGPVNTLRLALDHDLPKATAFLSNAVRALEDYVAARPPESAPAVRTGVDAAQEGRGTEEGRAS